MPATCCALTKPDGDPCHARPLPGRPFCLFHDPDQAARLAEARRRGGSTPRRRIRRFPRLLDHYHIAELLGELFIASLNDPTAIDSKRLQAITHLARTLLKAVGTPTGEYLEHDDRAEPAVTADHLLRIYPPLPVDIEALLAADPSAAGNTETAAPGAQTPKPPSTGPLNAGHTVIPLDDPARGSTVASFPPPRLNADPASSSPGAAVAPEPLPDTTAPSAHIPGEPAVPVPPNPAGASLTAPAAADQSLQEAVQDLEQVPNRPGTGSSATEASAPPSRPPPAYRHLSSTPAPPLPLPPAADRSAAAPAAVT